MAFNTDLVTTGIMTEAASRTSQTAGARATRVETSPSAARSGIYGAILILVGSLLSGPVGMILVAIVQPAEAWHGAKALATHYHAI